MDDNGNVDRNERIKIVYKGWENYLTGCLMKIGPFTIKNDSPDHVARVFVDSILLFKYSNEYANKIITYSFNWPTDKNPRATAFLEFHTKNHPSFCYATIFQIGNDCEVGIHTDIIIEDPDAIENRFLQDMKKAAQRRDPNVSIINANPHNEESYGRVIEEVKQLPGQTLLKEENKTGNKKGYKDFDRLWRAYKADMEIKASNGEKTRADVLPDSGFKEVGTLGRAIRDFSKLPLNKQMEVIKYGEMEEIRKNKKNEKNSHNSFT